MSKQINEVVIPDMIEEEKNHVPPVARKRKAKSASPDIEYVARRRCIERTINNKEVAPITPSTLFIIPKKPFQLEMKIQARQTLSVKDKRYVYYMGPMEFNLN